ncbi:hypothetical protein D9Q98_006253 [Chlorella vulgaris]|uniref:PIN domain-containing protein n=1 Tax=Chlorella vulgaris TaxID=3077 RepID=A0A9D4Z1D3_CHLVU|nr:hypothetical protein D9Q98_006253 [Chlorella vulgaris]
MAKKKKKYAVPTGPKKGAGGSRGISKLKGQKAAAQTAVAADGDGLFAAPGTHVAKKRKAAPEDPGLEDADQYMQPARKKKKKEQQQQVAPLSADSTAETEQCTHKYIADAAQPQQLQGQQRKQKWWQPKQPLKQKQKQKRKKALAQQLQLRAQKRNGQGALQPNKAAIAVAGGQLSWCVAGYPMPGAPGAVTVTQWHAMAAAAPPAPSRALRHLEAGKTFFCLDTNALVGGSSDVQQAWAAIQAAGGGSVQLMVPLKVVYEVKAGRNNLVEGRTRQPFSHASSLLNALMGSHSCCRVQRDDEVYRGHPKRIANQKGDSAILDCLLYFTSLNATVVLCTNDVKFSEHAAQHNVRTITHSELPLAVAGALWGSRAAPDDAGPGVSPAALFQAGVQAAMQPASQLMADMQRLTNTQLLVSMQLTAMVEHLAAAQQPRAPEPLQALQAPGPCLRLPPAQPPPLMRLMPPLWGQEPHLTYALHPSQQPQDPWGPPITHGGSINALQIDGRSAPWRCL